MIADSNQRSRAIEEAGHCFAVEASAGTGKTSTLVDRICHLVLERGPKGPTVPVSSVCAITFTEKAAGEMKLRLRQKFEEAASDEGEKGDLARAALRDLEAAAISTFHAFAVSLLKERPVEAGLDPRFNALDELQSTLHFRGVWEPWITRALVGRREPLEAALRAGLSLDQIRDLAETLRAHAYTVRQLRLQQPLSDEQIDQPLNELRRESAEYQSLVRDPEDLLALQFEQTISWLEHPDAGVPPGSAKGGKGGNWEGGRETIQRVKDFISRAGTLAELRGRLSSQRIFYGLVSWLIDELLPEWDNWKRANAYLDFDDQLEIARNLLVNSPAARRDFQNRFATLLVDEFQDTDQVQLDIVLLLSCTDLSAKKTEQLRPDPGRLFIVGDPKQSIYRFRGADVETYLETVDDTRLRALGLERLELTTNFRSVPSILRFVDAVFENAMREEEHFQRKYLPFGGEGARTAEVAPPSVHVLGDRDEDGTLLGSGKDYFERESKRIARLISQMRGNDKWRVTDPSSGTSRAPGYQDIAVLLPVLTKVDVLEEELRAAGIPYVLEGGKFYYARSEVDSAITVLRALANPNDTVALYGALRSVFFGISDEDLLQARIDGIPLDYRCEAAESSPLHRSFGILRDLHLQRHMLPASETFEMLLQQTGAREVLAVRGFQSLANLTKLSRQLRALQQETTFSEVVALLGTIDEEELAESESRLMEERGEAVRVMTVHKAKGLDFPIVIVACLGAVRKPRSETFLADAHSRLKSFALKQGTKEAGWWTPGWEDLAEADKKRENAELVRLLYVALTRARDHMVIGVHTKGKIEKCSGKLKACFAGTRLEPLSDSIGGLLSGNGSLVRFIDTSFLDAAERPSRAAADSRAKDWGAILRSEYRELHRLVTETPYAREVLAPALAGGGEAIEDRATETAGKRAIRLGVAFHEAMEVADFRAPDVTPRVREDAVDVHRLDPSATREIGEMLRLSLASPLIERARAVARAGGRIFKELPYVRPLPETDGCSFVDGKIDLLFEEDGGWVLVDYKTDRVPEVGSDIEEFYREKYSAQMSQYIAAMRALGLNVKAAHILLARTGQSVQFE